MTAIVEELTIEAPPQRVWGAITQQDEIVRWISKSPPQWAGSSVTWQLTPVHNGTKLIFTHDGFAQADEAHEGTRGAWVYFLASLKSYLETRKGTPGTPPGFK